MKRFTRLTGPVASLPEDNVDTDIIFPARFLLITAREGLGRYAFHDRRFDPDGAEQPSFILNRDPWRTAPILIAGANFGSGSSREQAVWALVGQGIQCIIAPSFGEIFFANCFRNGVLPIVTPAEHAKMLALHAEAGQSFTIDLETKFLRVGDGPPFAFDVAPEQRLALLNGWDETALILNARGDDIERFEAQHRQRQPWLFETGEPR
jgi:3-isopropylmalate/(R)-2-methylmalate dehydratase small subunit